MEGGQEAAGQRRQRVALLAIAVGPLTLMVDG